MARFVSRWARRLGIAALLTVGITTAALGGLALWNVSTDMWEVAAPLPVLAVPAPLPRVVAPPYELPPLPEIDATVPAPTDLTEPQ